MSPTDQGGESPAGPNPYQFMWERRHSGYPRRPSPNPAPPVVDLFPLEPVIDSSLCGVCGYRSRHYSWGPATVRWCRVCDRRVIPDAESDQLHAELERYP